MKVYSRAVKSMRVSKSIVTNFWAVSDRARALAWRVARYSALSRMMTILTISPRNNPRHEPTPARPRHTPPFTNGRLISAGDRTRAGWMAHASPCTIAPPPSAPGDPARLISFDDWLVFIDDGRDAPKSCLAARVTW